MSADAQSENGTASRQTSQVSVSHSPGRSCPHPMAVAPSNHRKRSWLARYQSRNGAPGNDGKEREKEDQSSALASSPSDDGIVVASSPEAPSSAVNGSPISSSFSSRRSTSTLLTDCLSNSILQERDLDHEASQLNLNAIERGISIQSQLKPPEPYTRTSGSFGKMAFNSMMGGLSALSLTRSSTNTPVSGDDKESRGRTIAKGKHVRSASAAFPADPDSSQSRSRARSQSPFYLRRFRSREISPAPQPVPIPHYERDSQDIAELGPPPTSFADDQESGDETVGETDAETEDEDYCLDQSIDPLTERNTERNTFISVPNDLHGGLAGLDGDDVDIDPDPLGEGVNVVVPREPYFPSTLNYSNAGGAASSKSKRNPRRRKSRHHEAFPTHNSRPIFQRDRCTIVITQGDPDGNLDERKRKTYIVASDLSEESRYAVEWGIGTVLRDGDEMMIVTIIENEHKVDPPIPNAADRAIKLRSQQERQGLAYILVRQATSLLQRTKLHVKVSCQAWHAKNARHILLDIVDYQEPTMLIVGSRGVGRLKGMLLGSTSHYLIQKCSVPVMVARRRLKRPPRHSAHLLIDRRHVSLAEAGIDRVVAKVDRDTKSMIDEINKADDRPKGVGGGSHVVHELGEDLDDGEVEEDEPEGVKVTGRV